MGYWQKRSEDLAKTEYLNSEEFIKRVRALYVQALSRIDAQTLTILRKMLKDDKLSMARAREYLSDNDLEVFRMDLDDYIKLASENLTPDNVEKLEMASAVHHLTKLQAINLHLEKELELLAAKYRAEMADFLKKTYEDSYFYGIFTKQTLSGYESVSGINKYKLEKIITKPWTRDGNNFSDRIWQDKEKLLRNLYDEIFNSVARGEGLDSVSNRFASEMDSSYFNAKRLIHTESAFFSNEAFKDSIYGEADGFEVLASLDKRTCDECGSKDGKHYAWEEYEVGKTAPPFHPFCRCTIIPWFDDVKDETRMARGDDGKSRYIEDMSYDEWKKKYVDKVDDNGYNITKGEYQTGDSVGRFGTLTNNPKIKINMDIPNRHSWEKLKERNIDIVDIDKWMKYGACVVQDGGNKYVFITKEGTAVVRKDGKLITAWAKNDYDENMVEIIKKLYGGDYNEK